MAKFRLNDIRDELRTFMDDIRLMGSLLYHVQADNIDMADGLSIISDIINYWSPMAMFAYSDEIQPEYGHTPKMSPLDYAIRNFRKRLSNQNK